MSPNPVETYQIANVKDGFLVIRVDLVGFHVRRKRIVETVHFGIRDAHIHPCQRVVSAANDGTKL